MRRTVSKPGKRLVRAPESRCTSLAASGGRSERINRSPLNFVRVQKTASGGEGILRPLVYPIQQQKEERPGSGAATPGRGPNPQRTLRAGKAPHLVHKAGEA